MIYIKKVTNVNIEISSGKRTRSLTSARDTYGTRHVTVDIRINRVRVDREGGGSKSVLTSENIREYRF